jgi:cobalt-zinc-cadmium efflux system protein
MDAIPEHIDAHAVESYLNALPTVVAVHDVHIWAMSTTEVALAVHLVMEVFPSDDTFLHNLTRELEEQFGIRHTTTYLQHGAHCHQAAEEVV